uniref:Uncharacterized protein n=1 Tax=Ditylenchus dipsaci TaxID=166011 RepID=A0A915ECK6_9BILA
MKSFKWTNQDVVIKLQARKDGKISDADVQKFLKSSYNKEVPRMTIFRHLPASTTAEPEESVIELKSKFGGKMLAVRDGQEYRCYKLWRRTTYQCTDCFHLRQNLNLKFPLLLVTKSGENFKPNEEAHHKDGRSYDYETLIARNVDRIFREKAGTDALMNPQQAFENAQKMALELTRKQDNLEKSQVQFASSFRHGRKFAISIQEEGASKFLKRMNSLLPQP